LQAQDLDAVLARVEKGTPLDDILKPPQPVASHHVEFSEEDEEEEMEEPDQAAAASASANGNRPAAVRSRLWLLMRWSQACQLHPREQQVQS
jgi:hypothetical protein